MRLTTLLQSVLLFFYFPNGTIDIWNVWKSLNINNIYSSVRKILRS